MAGLLSICLSKLTGEACNTIIEDQPSLYKHKTMESNGKVKDLLPKTTEKKQKLVVVVFSFFKKLKNLSKQWSFLLKNCFGISDNRTKINSKISRDKNLGLCIKLFET
ncbi:hypothetical protein GAMM_280004 [Gammaproteobacteria bacterium]